MNQASDRYDVVIVGARCAGAATAMLLARRGLNVLVLERSRRGSDTLSTHALMRGGAVQLRRWGLLDQIAAAGTPPIRRTVFHYGDDTTTVSIKPAAGVDALYAPRRTLLDRMLVDAAVAAGAQVRFGVDVTSLERDAGGRVVGVLARARNGDPLRARAWLTVGADGARSLVARAAGSAVQRTGVGASAFIYGYWDGLDVTGYEWFYRPGGSAGMIPTNDNAVCVFAGTTTDRFRRELTGDVRAGYLRLLKEVTGSDERLDATSPPRRLHAHPGRAGFVRRAWGPGWALVGDAGQFLDPLSTHGMTDALRDAQLLSHAVAAVVRGEEEVTAFSGYEARRDQIAGPLFSVVDQLAAYQWTIPTVRRLLLELSSAMSDEVEALSALRADA
jgi:2-polyprenyl-6-methoxyphenol hydroxylase-like FAD-dependent oxidoreductase